MTQMIHGFIIVFALSLLVVGLTMNPAFAEQPGKGKGKGEGKGEGLTLELVHRYSIHSPLYSPNLTTTEKTKRLIEISDRRSLEIGLTSAANESRVMGVRPIIKSAEMVYMVKLSIGTPPIFTHLHFDTASTFTWTQCAPCHRCFSQAPRMYQETQSSTYRAVPCHHPLCAGLPCIDNQCHYAITYVDGANTKGYLVADRLTFASDHSSGHSEAIDDVVFGCSKESNTSMYPYETPVSGIIGMSVNALSFLMQLGERAKGRFSYCLVPPEHAGLSYLRFGTDIEHIQHEHTTPLLAYHNNEYHVDLRDLSVDGRLLHLPSDTFKINSDGSGGCTVDTGSWINYMVESAFHALVRTLEEHFQRHNLRRVREPHDWNLQLCYEKPSGFSSYPAIAFHLRGAVLRPTPKSFFYHDEGSSTFCLFMKGESRTIIGAIVQQNHRMVFDVRKHRLTFAQENCAHN